MRSLKVLFFAVLVPGALSAALYSALSSDDDPDIRVIRAVGTEVERAVEAERLDEIVEAVVVEQVASGRCEHGRTEESRLDADGVEMLAVKAGSGSLDVVGRADVDDVVVEASMCASSEDLLEGLRADLGREGDRAVVTTDYPSSRGFGNRYARIDLRILVPLGMRADLEDSSGELHVSGTGDTWIQDSSGEIEAQGVIGSMNIRDGSGEISLRDIAGDVDLVDGSGEINLVDLGGSVTLTDGSGTIDIRDVAGSVEVRADGSGSIEVTEVGGDFTVRADGSGSIRHSRVEGRVDIPRKSRR